MAEIIGIFWLTRIVSRMAVAKGYSKWYAALVPTVWFTTELVVMFGTIFLVPEIDQIALIFIALAGGVSGGAVVYLFMKMAAPRNVPTDISQMVAAPYQAAASPTQVEDGRQALAGYCQECDSNVWLTPEGGCEHGHGRDSVSGVYWALR